MRKLAAILALSATPLTAQSVDPGTLPAVPADRAVALFAAICGDSLPNFDSATDRMSANGITDAAQTGTFYSSRENLSFKITDGPGAGKTCSMVFATQDDTEAFVRAAFTLGAFQETQLGLAAPYRGSIVLLGDRPTSVGSVTYHNLRLLSQR